jgi:Holliday junction resolvase
MQSTRGLDAVERILRLSGFQVDREPTLIGSSFLPVTPDIIATREKNVYVIEIKSKFPKFKGTFPVDIAQQVKTSGEVYRTYELEKDVIPVLILVEGEASSRLQNFSKEENVKLVRIDQEFIQQALEEADESRILEMANKITGGI